MAENEDLAERVAALEASLAGAPGLVAQFDGALQQMSRTLVFTGREVDTLSRGIGGGLRRAFDGLVFDGMRLSDALGMVAKSMVDGVYSAAMRPVQNALGGAVAQGLQGAMSSLMPFAQGGGFAQGRVMPFAEGGVVSGPITFPMRGGTTGLMGEAGPEAIMPLTRGADGSLGVKSQGGGAVNITMNISTPDVAGFQRSQSQIAASMTRALGRGQRNR